MIGEQVIVGAIDAWITSRKIDRWAKLCASVFFSGLMTFLCAFGSAGITHLAALGQPPMIAAAYALFEACVATSGIILLVLRKSGLAKGLLLVVPNSVDSSQNNILQNEGVTIYEKK